LQAQKKGHPEYTLKSFKSCTSDPCRSISCRTARGTCGARDAFDPPAGVFGKLAQEALDMAAKAGRSRTNSAAERLQEPSRMIRSAAFNAARSISVSVQIPTAVDPLALGKVADAFTAALFVKDADQLLKGPAFHVTEPLVGVGDQLIDRVEI
jgi:hypothetical protein